MYGDLLLNLKQYDEAKQLYGSFNNDRKPIWVELGIAQIAIEENRLDEAKIQLSRVIENNQYCIEAHDLLASIYLKEGKTELAQHELSTAVKLSPRSIQRQRELGRVSEEAQDMTASVRAYRSAVKNSKNSCHESAEDYLNLSQSLTHLAEQEQSNLKKHTEEAFDTVKQMNRKYQNQPIYAMRGKLIESDLFEVIEQPAKAQAAIEQALAIHKNLKYSVLANTPPQVSIDCAKALMAKGKFDEGEKLLQELAEINDDPELTIKIDKLRRDPTTKEGRLFAAKENKIGVELYQKKDYEGALKAFTKVLNDMPSHIGLNLNMIQALISRHRSIELTAPEKRQLKSCFQRIGQLPPGSQYNDRYQYLVKLCNKLCLLPDTD